MRTPAVLLVSVAAFACSSARPAVVAVDHSHDDHAAHAGMMDHTGMPELAPIPTGSLVTPADVHFMQGMIAHHAQAIYMSRLADSRGASPRLLRFAQKIDQSQEAEIALMQAWLRDHNQVAPDTSSHRTISMPGMLTDAQKTQLEAARGADFDRHFLEMMIQHHEGALKMVADLFATPRAAQEVDISVFANEVYLVQTIEIDVMRQMLTELQGA